MSGDSSNSSQSAWIVIAMLAMIAVPAAITLNTVRSPGKLQLLNPNPSPHGYTWNLLPFAVPIAAIRFWFLSTMLCPSMFGVFKRAKLTASKNRVNKHGYSRGSSEMVSPVLE